MATDREAPDQLTDEQRARVHDCLTKEGLLLSQDSFEQLIRCIETSIDNFLTTPIEGPFREAHDALRQLFELSHDEDPSVALLRNRVRALPTGAIKYIDGRAPIVSERLFPGEPQITRFQEWAKDADPAKLILATRVLAAEGARWVKGRSRGGGKRTDNRLEPSMMGEVRGAGAADHKGGAPTGTAENDLIRFLALDWQRAAGHRPKSGRSDKTGFGDLVHSVFQWLNLPEGAASYALRRYWAEITQGEARRESGIC
jgi:hypothetical protein